LEQVATQHTRQAWVEIFKTQKIAYQYTPFGTQAVTEKREPASEPETLQIPIRLHDQKIGVIEVKRKDNQGNWQPREQAMLQEIAAQVALALENARLLDDAQRRAARERSVGEMTARIGSAYDVDSILRVTAQEIGRAIGDAEVSVQIRNEESIAKQ
jgi:GAF domain-containing protein